MNNALDELAEYAVARFGSNVTILRDEDRLRLKNVDDSAARIQIVKVDEHFVFVAGQIQLDPREPGTAPILHAMDAVMSFEMILAIGALKTRSLVGPASQLRQFEERHPRSLITRSRWRGEVLEREVANARFGIPDGQPLLLKSSAFHGSGSVKARE